VRCEGKTLVARGGRGRARAIPFDEIIVAVGRKARLTGYGLEELGIETDKTVVTNDYLRRSTPTSSPRRRRRPYQFTHFAAHQAWYAAVNALFGTFRKFRTDYSRAALDHLHRSRSRACRPQRSERARGGIAYEVVRYDLGHLDRAVAEGAKPGFVKLLVAARQGPDPRRHHRRANAGEMLAEYVLAMKHGSASTRSSAPSTPIRPWPRRTNMPPASGRRRTSPTAPT
jgi:pyruvate/2-oxoglutarate dehydrogenase complex dihydrolipoamide dehydrogenase (E3) component